MKISAYTSRVARKLRDIEISGRQRRELIEMVNGFSLRITGYGTKFEREIDTLSHEGIRGEEAYQKLYEGIQDEIARIMSSTPNCC